MDKLRSLNFDDLYILKYLRDGLTLTAIAKKLSLTQPAITQRVRKMEQTFETALLIKTGRSLQLSQTGLALTQKARDALTLLGPTSSTSLVNIRVGTRPAAGKNWLWPVITQLKKSHPHLQFHLSFGTGQDILAKLETDQLDVILSSSPTASKKFQSIELAKEDYHFVCSPKLAKKIKSIDDLQDHTFIEHDSSMPFLNYLPAHQKRHIKFKDTWYLESIEIMVEAIAAGYGIGIIPGYLAKPYFKQKKLAIPNLDIDIGSDLFRLIFHKNNFNQEFHILANTLKEVGLDC